MFNKIRFESKINIKMWSSFEILESFVGERVNKIRFDGNIRLRVVSTYNSVFGRKREKRQEKRSEPREAVIFDF